VNKAAIFKTLEVVLIALMTLLVVNVLWQVFSRYALNSPSRFTDELARYMMIWIGLLGAAYVSGERGHIAIDLFSKNKSPEAQKNIRSLISMLIIAFALTVLIIGGSWLVYTRFILEVTSAALKVPMALVYLALPLSGILIIYFEVVHLLSEPKI
jgi:TRAP-type C4-dicarboxylate transport system permease small subunit